MAEWERETLREVWRALGCASNPDDFKPEVRARMREMALEIIEGMVTQQSRVYRENQQLGEELRRVLSKVDTAAAWLEALGTPVPLMRKSHAILRELAPEPVEERTDVRP